MLRVTNSRPEMRHIIQIEINNGIKTHNIYYESKQVASNNHTCQNKITHIYLFKGHLAFGINRLIHFDFPCHHHVLHLQQQCAAIDRKTPTKVIISCTTSSATVFVAIPIPWSWGFDDKCRLIHC